MNDDIWANLKLKNDWQLYVQRLYSDESITDGDKQIDVPIRRYHPATRSYDSVQEIIFEDFTIDALKSKVRSLRFIFILPSSSFDNRSSSFSDIGNQFYSRRKPDNQFARNFSTNQCVVDRMELDYKYFFFE